MQGKCPGWMGEGLFTINCPAPPVVDLTPPQHLRSKFSGATPVDKSLHLHNFVLFKFVMCNPSSVCVSVRVSVSVCHIENVV